MPNRSKYPANQPKFRICAWIVDGADVQHLGQKTVAVTDPKNVFAKILELLETEKVEKTG